MGVFISLWSLTLDLLIYFQAGSLSGAPSALEDSMQLLGVGGGGSEGRAGRDGTGQGSGGGADSGKLFPRF